MATLWQQLDALYPKVLPADPAKAMNGTALLAALKDQLVGAYADSSLRQHFSEMSKDTTSAIAKVTTGNGSECAGASGGRIGHRCQSAIGR